MVKRKSVIWDKETKSSFKKAIQWTKQDSPKNANKIKVCLLKITPKLADHPEEQPPYKFKADRDSRFKAFEKYSYRIAYLIAEDTFRVLRFRYVKQEPQDY